MATRVGMVMTVLNEERLLRQNVLYHRHVGVERFFVFLDGTTDGTAASVADLDSVSLSASVDRDAFLSDPERREAVRTAPRLQKALDTTGIYTARQMLNAFVALQEARRAGIDWVVLLDADELVCLDLDDVRQGDLVAFLDSVETSVEQVRFTPLEVVPSARDVGNPFAEVTLFKTRRPRLHRRTWDPIHDSYVSLPAWQGHRKGKSAVRVEVNPLPRVHDCVALDGRDLETRKRGHLLHYQLFDFRAFLTWARHHRDHPDRFLWGHPVPLAKRLWRDVVNFSGLSENDLREYYERWVVLGEPVIEKARLKTRRWGLFRRRPWITEVGSVADVFAELSRHKASPWQFRGPSLS